MQPLWQANTSQSGLSTEHTANEPAPKCQSNIALLALVTDVITEFEIVMSYTVCH